MGTTAKPHHHDISVPRGAIVGAAVLLVLSMALAGAARRQNVEAALAAVPQPAMASVELRFEDRPDGTVAALDAASGHEVAAYPPGTNGFVRGVLRGMFRTRKLESLSRDAVFRLARVADGRLVLEDRQSGHKVDLDAFGPTNTGAFAKLLEGPR